MDARVLALLGWVVSSAIIVASPPAEDAKERAATLVSRYRKACEAGDQERARKLARKAVALDPTCFGNASTPTSRDESANGPLRMQQIQQMQQVLNASEGLREIEKEWHDFWFPNEPPQPVANRLPGVQPAIAVAPQNTGIQNKSVPLDLVVQPVKAEEEEEQSDVANLLPYGQRPSRDEILRVLPPVTKDMPKGFEVRREDVEIEFEKIADRADPPRFYPTIGPAKLHTVHWKCQVSYIEMVVGNQPFPFRVGRPRTEMVYIDKSHLELVKGSP